MTFHGPHDPIPICVGGHGPPGPPGLMPRVNSPADRDYSAAKTETTGQTESFAVHG